ncbi:MAG: hypothetical protein HY455_01940 [Parcubacteria group bacterium]|nr:hypothetical protein [Parcubacteria group bacterium]
MKNTLFMLGAADPEMDHIAAILKACGLTFAFARNGKERVSPHTAYTADLPDLSNVGRLVCVECRPMFLQTGPSLELVVIDHHREGDPGYDLGATQYWEASSLGQLIQFLQTEMPDVFAKFDFASAEVKLHHIAAADHCLAVAYKGKCPGIDVDRLHRLVVNNIAEATGIRIGVVKLLIWSYARILKKARTISMGDVRVSDMTSEYLGEGGYTPEYLALRTAAMSSRRIYLCKYRDAPSESREKIMLNGDASPRVIEHFMKVWAPAHGLVDIYGVPKRGYAAGSFPFPS